MAFTRLKTQGLSLPTISSSPDNESRKAFQEGRVSQRADMAIYESILEEKHHGNNTH
jgi:hypothetical protein